MGEGTRVSGIFQRFGLNQINERILAEQSALISKFNGSEMNLRVN